MDGYRTVFEVSYLANGYLRQSLAFLSAGVGVLLFGLWWFRRPRPLRGLIVWRVWCVLWLGLSGLFVARTLGLAATYTRALQSGGCDVVEGAVEVLDREPATGHHPGDLVRVGGREFEFSYFHATPAYNRTLANGGVLTNGARVRLPHLDGSILKVEVAD